MRPPDGAAHIDTAWRDAARDDAPGSYDALLARVAEQLRRPGRPGRPPTRAAARGAAARLVNDVARVVLDWLEPA